MYICRLKIVVLWNERANFRLHNSWFCSFSLCSILMFSLHPALLLRLIKFCLCFYGILPFAVVSVHEICVNRSAGGSRGFGWRQRGSICQKYSGLWPTFIVINCNNLNITLIEIYNLLRKERHRVKKIFSPTSCLLARWLLSNFCSHSFGP